MSRVSSMDCIGTGRRKKRPEYILNLAQGGRSGNPVWRIFVEWTIRKPEPGQWQSLNRRKCCQLFPVGPLTRHESTYEREDSFRHFLDPEPLKPFCYSTCQKVTFLFFSPSFPSHPSQPESLFGKLRLRVTWSGPFPSHLEKGVETHL